MLTSTLLRILGMLSYIALTVPLLGMRSTSAQGGTYNGILEYDLAKKELSLIGLPPICKVSTVLVLMSVENDGLGFAMVHDDFSLCIWLRESAPTPSGGWTWTRHRVVDLKSFLPVSALSSSPYIVAAADVAGVFVIRAGRDDGILAIDLKFGQVRKVSDADGHIVNLFPILVSALQVISSRVPGNLEFCTVLISIGLPVFHLLVACMDMDNGIFVQKLSFF